MPEGGLLFSPPMDPSSQPLGKAYLEDIFSGVVSTELGPSPETHTHRGRQNHMDKSLPSRRALVNLTLSGTFLFPMETPLSVKLCTEHGDTESDSLCAALKLSFKQQLENPYNALPYP